MNQTILITGGSSGIGLAIARKFMKNNYNVVVTGRNLSKLEKVKSDLPSIHIEQSDVCNEEEVKSLVLKMEQIFGGIDILFNNAGIMNLIDAGSEEDQLNKQFTEIEINFHAPIRMLHYFLPQLKKSKNAVVVNVSSGLAYVPFAQAPTYSGTKAALHFWTMGIRPQLKPHNIRVVELLPPVVDTPLAHEADIAEDDNLKPMPPDKMADIFWKHFMDGKDEITPGLSKQLKFMSRLAPKFIFKQLNKQPIPSKKT
ncbi:SDR family oxidoreductase [Leptospira sp. GIMC2001]|uniref:SDR family oxidoreductase n=1 Tax=Leptospira sp. GIMC2001 TaxID=1513297 RepID=UPI0023497225|nr:SDR family NAD(P)-dependent oxidoreductase [Leptospira sp. GIMC2001]WCL49922.1 SDR family NAD(P)-dependent oxidoreductase [Leptospira sp. GIMC2001]